MTASPSIVCRSNIDREPMIPFRMTFPSILIITLVGLSFLAPELNGQNTHPASETNLDSSGADLARKGEEHFEAGRIDDALPFFMKGWDKHQNVRCLLGITTIHLLRGNHAKIGDYIEPILAEAKSDITFLRYAISYSLHSEDKTIFIKCLSITKPQWLNSDQSLQSAISKGAVFFFASPPNVPPGKSE